MSLKLNSAVEAAAFFEREGYYLTAPILSTARCEELQRLAWSQTRSGGNRNLLRENWCASLIPYLKNLSPLDSLIPSGFVAIQCTYFEKSTTTNWLVPIHQDLSIPVKQRIEHSDLNGWSIKDSEQYVQAPIEFTEQMIAVRIHLEDCTEEDGPVVVLPRTHRLGKISNREALQFRQNEVSQVCILNAGAALIMRPTLLHLSSKASGHSRRRVLHFVFAPQQPPCDLEYACAIG